MGILDSFRSFHSAGSKASENDKKKKEKEKKKKKKKKEKKEKDSAKEKGGKGKKADRRRRESSHSSSSSRSRSRSHSSHGGNGSRASDADTRSRSRSSASSTSASTQPATSRKKTKQHREFGRGRRDRRRRSRPRSSSSSRSRPSSSSTLSRDRRRSRRPPRSLTPSSSSSARRRDDSSSTLDTYGNPKSDASANSEGRPRGRRSRSHSPSSPSSGSPPSRRGRRGKRQRQDSSRSKKSDTGRPADKWTRDVGDSTTTDDDDDAAIGASKPKEERGEADAGPALKATSTPTLMPLKDDASPAAAVLEEALPTKSSLRKTEREHEREREMNDSARDLVPQSSMRSTASAARGAPLPRSDSARSQLSTTQRDAPAEHRRSHPTSALKQTASGTSGASSPPADAESDAGSGTLGGGDKDKPAAGVRRGSRWASLRAGIAAGGDDDESVPSPRSALLQKVLRMKREQDADTAAEPSGPFAARARLRQSVRIQSVNVPGQIDAPGGRPVPQPQPRRPTHSALQEYHFPAERGASIVRRQPSVVSHAHAPAYLDPAAVNARDDAGASPAVSPTAADPMGGGYPYPQIQSFYGGTNASSSPLGGAAGGVVGGGFALDMPEPSEEGSVDRAMTFMRAAAHTIDLIRRELSADAPYEDIFDASTASVGHLMGAGARPGSPATVALGRSPSARARLASHAPPPPFSLGSDGPAW